MTCRPATKSRWMIKLNTEIVHEIGAIWSSAEAHCRSAESRCKPEDLSISQETIKRYIRSISRILRLIFPTNFKYSMMRYLKIDSF